MSPSRPNSNNRSCKNCGEKLRYFSDRDGYWFCEDCCRIGKWGMFIGGLLIGAAAALLKLVS